MNGLQPFSHNCVFRWATEDLDEAISWCKVPPEPSMRFLLDHITETVPPPYDAAALSKPFAMAVNNIGRCEKNPKLTVWRWSQQIRYFVVYSNSSDAPVAKEAGCPDSWLLDVGLGYCVSLFSAELTS